MLDATAHAVVLCVARHGPMRHTHLERDAPPEGWVTESIWGTDDFAFGDGVPLEAQQPFEPTF